MMFQQHPPPASAAGAWPPLQQQQQQQRQPLQSFVAPPGFTFTPSAPGNVAGALALPAALSRTVGVSSDNSAYARGGAPTAASPQHGTVVRPFALAGGPAVGVVPAAAPTQRHNHNHHHHHHRQQHPSVPHKPAAQLTSVTIGGNLGAVHGATHLQYDPVQPPPTPPNGAATGSASSSSSTPPLQQSGSGDAFQQQQQSAVSNGSGQLQTMHRSTGSGDAASDPTKDANAAASTAAAPAQPLVQLGKLHQGAAVLLRADTIEEVRLMATHHAFACPKSMRKQLTKQYREMDQIVVMVAIGDALAARAVMASDVIPRGNARRSIPDVEAAMPAHWTNVFRVTCAAVLDAEGLALALPCPVSDRSELPSQVPIGFVIPRVWNSTLHGIIDATIALASGKSGHYHALLAAVRECGDPEALEEVPASVADLVAPVRMVSHGPGVVALGYVARYFGRQGRQFIANALFGLQSGVIDLCRQNMGGCLIAYLVRHGTCATPRILQLVPWRVVASRVLSDAVGSQTASLMLHSALQFHRTTRRGLDPVALTSLTHRVLTKNLADATDPTSDWTLTAVASNAQSCRVLQLVVEACVELLAMHSSGEVEATPEIAQSAQKVVTALCDLAAKHALDPWSNYATQSLISACTLQRETTPEAVRRGQYLDSLLARVMVSVRPSIEHLSCHKSGSNVVEKLCRARPGVTVEVASALVEIPGALSRLVADRFGNYVVQTLLLHLPPVPAVEESLRAALVPILRSLDPHWHCAVAIDTWLRRVAARLGPMPGAHQQQQLLNAAPIHGGTGRPMVA